MGHHLQRPAQPDVHASQMTQCASKCHETRRGLHIIYAFDARRSRWCVKYNLADRVDDMVAWMSVRRLRRERASNSRCGSKCTTANAASVKEQIPKRERMSQMYLRRLTHEANNGCLRDAKHVLFGSPPMNPSDETTRNIQ